MSTNKWIMKAIKNPNSLRLSLNVPEAKVNKALSSTKVNIVRYPRLIKTLRGIRK